jgi:transitional endoplasmic reticulum ATPase
VLRPSRFRPISIALPDLTARREIATHHARYFGYTLGDTMVEQIARATEGMNGDEIGSVFRDARADELVGSRKEAGARRFGTLIGLLRRTQQQRDLERLRGEAPGRPVAREARRDWSSLGEDEEGDEIEVTGTEGLRR